MMLASASFFVPDSRRPRRRTLTSLPRPQPPSPQPHSPALSLLTAITFVLTEASEPSSSPIVPNPPPASGTSNLTPPMPGPVDPRTRTTSSTSSLPSSGTRARSPTSSSSRAATTEKEREGDRGRSVDAERERSRPGRTASRSREQDKDRVPFPREDTPALPSGASPASASSSKPPSNGNVTRSMSASSAPASAPSNSHIPLAMQHRHRENSAPDPRAKLLATAAARAPGSPPQHTMALAQQQNSPQGQGRERGGGGLERQGSMRGTPELALDLKRLLAKPVSVFAAPVPHSDSEELSEGRRPSLEGSHVRRKHYDASGKRVEEQMQPRKSSEVVNARRSEEHRAREKTEREVALALVAPFGQEKEKEKEKRQKNVLRRRPSAQRPQTAPAETPIPSPTLAVPSMSPASRTAPVLSLNLSLNPISIPSFDSSSPKRSPRRDDTSPSSGQLTPAGAVVEAYKRGLPSPGASPLPSPTSPMFQRKPASDSGHGHVPPSPKVATPPATPYYTVFGSTSGRVVAVGGPGDWDMSGTAFQSLDGVRKTAKATVGKTLTRKVSERWTKKREDSEEEVRGRTSSQTERRKKSTRSASRGHGAEDSPAEEIKSPLSVAHEDLGFMNEPRSRRSEPALASGGGSKIWKLMKRISTGGLKEKYDRGASRTLPPLPPMPPMPVPPVPQLPREHALEARSAMSSDGHSEEPGVLSRFMQSRTSLSASRPTTSSAIPRPSARSLPMPPPIPASQSQPRTSTTTRSSSPVSSSENASSKYFHKTTSSGRSSPSSFGEEAAPPMPGQPHIFVGKHIVPPSELYKLELGADFKPSSLDDRKLVTKPLAMLGARSQDDWRIVATPAEEHPPLSLPHPPRRLPTPNVNAKERRVSDALSIPEFSTAEPVNAFAPRKAQLPPDLPRVENLLQSLGPAPAGPRRSTSSANEPSGVQDDTFGRQNRRMSSAPASSQQRQKRAAQRATSVPRTPQEPLTFRELTKDKSAQLTEKEKADKWEDLLERSNRAGGTIHLGTSDHLASDDVSLRYSASSAQLLKDF